MRLSDFNLALSHSATCPRSLMPFPLNKFSILIVSLDAPAL
jgi:hypothetical protein